MKAAFKQYNTKKSGIKTSLFKKGMQFLNKYKTQNKKARKGQRKIISMH